MFNFTNTSPYLSNVDDQLLFQKLKTYIDSINQNKEIINQIQLLTQSSSNNQGSLSQLLDNLISRVGEDENKQQLQTIQINQLNQLVSQIQAGILVQAANTDFEFKDDEDKLVALQQSLNQLSQFLTQANVKILDSQSRVDNLELTTRELKNADISINNQLGTQITSINSSISALAAKEANDIKDVNNFVVLNNNRLEDQFNNQLSSINTSISALAAKEANDIDQLGSQLRTQIQSQPQIPIPVSEINTKYLVNKSQASYVLQTGVEHKDIVNYQNSLIPGTCMIDNSVSGTKITDGTIQGTKIIDGTISGTKLVDGTIPGTKLLDVSVSGTKLMDGTIQGTKLTDGTIQGIKLADNSIQGTKIIDASIPGTKLTDGAIPGTKITDGTIPINKFEPRIKNQSKVFVTQAIMSGTDFIQQNSQIPTGIFQQSNWGGTGTIFSFLGPAWYVSKGPNSVTSASDFSFSDNIAATGSLASFFNSSFAVPLGGLPQGLTVYNQGYHNFLGASSEGCLIQGSVKVNQPIKFAHNQGTFLSYIDNAGNYNVYSDENVKSNIKIKTNYQEQLDKLLKVNIITFSYGAKYQKELDKVKQQLELDPSNKELQDQLFEIQYLQATCLQGFSFQNLQDSKLNYVWDDRVMDEEYLKQILGTNNDADFLEFKQKLEKRFEENKQKTICQADMIPYLVMGIKALNQKLEDQNNIINQLCSRVAALESKQQQTIQ